jgi:HSP20 family protein
MTTMIRRRRRPRCGLRCRRLRRRKASPGRRCSGLLERALARLYGVLSFTKVNAAFKNGVLTVTLAKKPEAQTQVKRIPISH